jgi:lysophospholipase L1-like esterase
LVLSFAFLIFTKGNTFNRNLFFAVLFVFSALELASRFIPEKNSYKEEIYRFYKPYVMFTGKPDGRHITIDKKGRRNEIKLNELGFRIEKPLPKKKTNDEVRIFVLGGSAVFIGSPLSNSIPGQIEQLFHHDGYYNVSVYNFGVVSYVSGQELALLLHTVSDYKPDLVVVYDGGNDVSQPYNYDPRPGYPIDFMVYEAGLEQIRNRASLNQLFSSFLYKSKVIRTVFRYSLRSKIVSLDQLRRDVNYRSKDWEISIVSTFINNLDKMCHLAKGFDFKLVVFLQPLAHFKSPLIGKEKNLLGGEEFQNYIKRQYDRIRPLLNNLNSKYADENRCYFVDLSYALKDYDRETFWDFVHIDNEGNKFIATQIYDYIKQREILKLKKSDFKEQG